MTTGLEVWPCWKLLGNCQRRRRKEQKGENTILFAAIDLEEYSLRYIIIFIMAVRTAGVNLLNGSFH
jgi:hypothetical protein